MNPVLWRKEGFGLRWSSGRFPVAFVWALPWFPWAYPVCNIGSQGEELLNFQILHHHVVPMLPHA